MSVPLETWQVFLCGFFGSLATEVITLYQLYLSTNFDDPNARVIPGRYRQVGFWIVRLAIAIMAGGLAVFYGIDKPLLAINVGAAAPLLIQALGQGIRPPTVSGALGSEGGGNPENRSLSN